MFLKKLELQGFKSFAQNTTFEFRRGVSAIVGPNGSGKSNIADALRFALGEQSMKLIRSKKGKDLIFSGSATKPRMNMASVTLHFENQGSDLGLDFESIIFKRKIFRDGENQYTLNDAQIRLKDLNEFIAKARLGLRGYTIINQGMGDAMLSASVRERKEIFFDALGLRAFQIKKHDATLKLGHTRTNLEKVYGIVQEIKPHLSFLKKQVEKIEERVKIEIKLKELREHYLCSKASEVHNAYNIASRNVAEKKEKIETFFAQLHDVEKEIEEKNNSISDALGDTSDFEKALLTLEREQNNTERELGRVEGMLTSAKNIAVPVQNKPVDNLLSFSHTQIESLKKTLKDILHQKTYEVIHAKITLFAEQFFNISNKQNSGTISTNSTNSPQISSGQVAQQIKNNINTENIARLEKQKNELIKLLSASKSKLQKMKETIVSTQDVHRETREEIFKLRDIKREFEYNISRAKNAHEIFNKEMITFNKEIEILNKEKEMIGIPHNISLLHGHDNLLKLDRSEMERNIERLKIKLENIDLIDTNVQVEYETTNKRYDFLTKESEDLENAVSSLEQIILDLDDIITKQFRDSFKKIHTKFNEYFTLLFEGGSAGLEIVDNSDGDYGIDIWASLPRKKTTGLSSLSGGERALTSLALLFALISISPPPFLVLDEIDAPLDDANSLRFIKILNELKEYTQFIVITHNRETMRQSDILCGITMEEDGVSKTLSLEFDSVPVET